jgi:hypothetical protein
MKKVFIYTVLGFFMSIFTLLVLLAAKAKFDHFRNLRDLADYVEFFKSVKHPNETSEVYFNSFFGNPANGNHCEHIIVQIRTYEPEMEHEIAEYYKNNYPDINVSFFKSVDDCCEVNELEYKSICIGNLFEDQPTFKSEKAGNFFPFYTLEYWVDGSYLMDYECN